MAWAERDRKIHGFAESQGWTAAILDAGFGTRAIFEPGKHPAIDLISDTLPFGVFEK